MRLSLLGPKGTYAEEVARAYAPDAEYIYAQDHETVIEDIQNGKADEGILAIENQLDGTLVTNLDLLYHAMLFINREVTIPVHHNLIGRKGKSIKRILSHPKALKQCSMYIKREHPEAELIECASTAGAVAELQGDPSGRAAIGSRFAAELYDLDVIASEIEDYSYNATRFFVVTKRECREGSKTTVLFVCSHKPGALWECIGSFAKNGVNLTKIESRPIRERSWEYLFFIDIEGGLQDERVRTALKDLQEHTSLLKVLGSYECDTHG